MRVKVKNNKVDVALRIFKRKLKESEKLIGLRKKEYYEKPSEKRTVLNQQRCFVRNDDKEGKMDVTPEQQQNIDDANVETVEFLFQMLQKYNPMVVSGVLTAMGLSVYKTILNPHEYELMCDSISSARDDINDLKILTDQRTLH